LNAFTTATLTKHGLKQSTPAILRQRAFKIILAGVMLALVVVAATLSVISNSHSTATQEWQERVSGLAGTIGAHAAQTVQSTDALLLDLVSMIASHEVSSIESLRDLVGTPAFHKVLKSRVSGDPHIEVLAVIDRDGYVLNNSLKHVPVYTFSQWGDTREAILDNAIDPVFVDVFTTSLSNTNEPVIGIGRKLFTRSGEFLGSGPIKGIPKRTLF